MSEWLKEHDWKSCVGVTSPWVRIPLSPFFPWPDVADIRFPAIFISWVCPEAAELIVRALIFMIRVRLRGEQAITRKLSSRADWAAAQ